MAKPGIADETAAASASADIRETFATRGGLIERTLSINGVSGVSRLPAPSGLAIAADDSQDALASAWDKTAITAAPTFRASGGGTDGEIPEIGVADLFCGAGGLSFGVREAVFACGLRPRAVLAADMDAAAMEVYRRNFDPANHCARNLWTSVTKNYSARKPPARFIDAPRVVSDEMRPAVGEVDILLGGPPCEGHSTSNNVSRRNDPRNRYYIVMPAMAVALDAKAVIVENVPGVRHDHRSVLETAVELFESAGYFVSESVVDAVRTGLPQTRKRHILIACKGGAADIEAAVRAVERPPRPLRWAIGDLMDADAESGDPLHRPAELSAENARRIDYLFDNGEYNLPDALRPDSHKGGHTYPSIYGRLRWDAPSGTITTGFRSPGRGRYIHPERRRTITAREAARIQGFPDRFQFKLINGGSPTKTALSKMIGDAVPPPIGYAAALAALGALTANPKR